MKYAFLHFIQTIFLFIFLFQRLCCAMPAHQSSPEWDLGIFEKRNDGITCTRCNISVSLLTAVLRVSSSMWSATMRMISGQSFRQLWQESARKRKLKKVCCLVVLLSLCCICESLFYIVHLIFVGMLYYYHYYHLQPRKSKSCGASRY